MKKILFLVMTILITTGCFTVVNAAEGITERSDIRITIDGVTNSYTNTPIIVNGRTLLPLRELLVNLGVANDDQHIIWNGKDKSVTVMKDSKKLYMRIGAAIGKINDKDVPIDVSPLNYNGRVYIPARFVAEAFDKVVAWDKYTSRIYIRDKSQYNEVKNLLDKAITSMDSVKRYQVTINDKTQYIGPDNDIIDGSDVTNQLVDREQKLSYYNSPSGELGVYEAYYANQRYYSKFSNNTQWDKTTVAAEDIDGYLQGYDALNLINPRDVIYASLITDRNQQKNAVSLKGDVYLLTKAAEIEPTSHDNVDKISDTYMEIIIDNATGYVTTIHVKEKTHFTPENADPFLADTDVTYTYSELNGNFNIKLPDYIARDSQNNANVPSNPVLTQEEQKTIDQLKSSSRTISIDGLYNNPYNLSMTQAIHFILLKDQQSFEAFNKMTDTAKIVLCNDSAQDHMGEYLGCSEVRTIVMFAGKAYSEVVTKYDAHPAELKLITYNGKEMKIVKQNKSDNTYQDYVQ